MSYPTKIRLSAELDSSMGIAVKCNHPDSGGKMYIVHYPSMDMDVVLSSDPTFVAEYSESDTLLVFYLVAGNHYTGWGVYATPKTVGVSPRVFRRPIQYTQTRDILGRPVSKSGSTQIRIDVAPSQDSRSRVSW